LALAHSQTFRFPVLLGRPSTAHGAEIRRLVSECKPLDLNSTYAYLLLCEHFAETCVRAEYAGRTVGFVSAYRPPERSDVIFVWQVAVAAETRGQGLAAAMLRDLLQRKGVRACRYLETTVSPSNEPSRRLFYALARDLGAAVTEKALFAEKHFGCESHEREVLLRIGPLTGQQPRGDLSDES
jgi:L-2,4-diaminobutyric acid acetyltransferase